MNKMPNPKVHNVRFYKVKPEAVYCMAIEPENNKLAVSRSDASVEIWNLSSAPFIERRIAGSTENFSIEGLAWYEKRLFSVGLHGLLIEYDLYKLDIKSRAVVTGEAAFCLDINKERTQIAIGTEQGYLNIFQITEDEVMFEKFLDKQEGRILCLKYDHSGQYIVSGSMDAIRIWSVSTNQALHKMVPGRSEQQKPTIVWCLAVTKDFTIISGDSRGILTVWDGKVGAQLESYQSHRADILSLCLSADENSLYCAGIDPNVVNYVRLKVKESSHKWVRSIQRKIHEHDVRALVLNGSKLYSSGVDGYLVCSYHPPKTLLKYPPLLQNPCVTVCRKSRYLLLRYPKHVEIWGLGVSGGKKDKSTGMFDLKSEPKKLAVVQKVVKTDDDEESTEGIICATMSDDGKFILYSTRQGVRLLKFVSNDGKPQLIPIELLDGLGEVPCINAIFISKNRFIISPNSGGLQVFGLNDDTPFLTQNINTDEIEETITLLTASPTSGYLVAGDVKSNIIVWTFKNNQFEFYCKLPKYKLAPTALAIHPKLFNLVVTYSNSNIIEYDLNKRELTEFSRYFSKNLPKDWTLRYSIIRNVTFDPRADHIIILHDDDSIMVISKNEEISYENIKIPRTARKTAQYPIRIIKKYKHLVHLSWLSDDEMVAVEVNPLSLIEQLPPCLIQTTFGRK